MNTVPIIYNLFPRYFNCIEEWTELLAYVSRMGFNHVFVNPFHATGFSGSLYAVKDYFMLNPIFLKFDQDPSDWSPLRAFVDECDKRGMRVVMDLVINHTAIDSFLVEMHPEWYTWDKKGKIVSPFAIDPADDSKVTVWRDLAKIDYEGTTDKKGLWKYIDDIVRFFQEMNIRCFRCDAAYQVPADLWENLVLSAKRRYPETAFFAETLGCCMEQIARLKDAGFDYLFNSSKWWHFDAPWCLEQHEKNGKIAPSISFPESHDTERLAKESPGTIYAQKRRYVLSAVFSEGLLMPMGYEYGARIKMDVVRGSPEDAGEKPLWDISKWIADMHSLKLSIPVMCEEGHWQALCRYDEDLFFMEKQSGNGNDPVLVCINKQTKATGHEVGIQGLRDKISGYSKLIHPCEDPCKQKKISETVSLKPGEIVIFTV